MEWHPLRSRGDNGALRNASLFLTRLAFGTLSTCQVAPVSYLPAAHPRTPRQLRILFSNKQPPRTMDFIWMLLIGLLVGIVAKFLMPGNDPGGFIVTILLGISGALIAGFTGRTLGWYGEGEPAGFIASVVGAMILLLVYRMFAGRNRPAHRH